MKSSDDLGPGELAVDGDRSLASNVSGEISGEISGEPPSLPDYNPFTAPHSQDPFPFYALLRERAPVHFSAPLGAWVVSRHEDVEAVLRAPGLFSSRGAIPSMFDNPPEVREVLAACCPEAPTLSELDPPAHTRMRRIFKVVFDAQRVERMRAAIERMAHALIDGLVDQGGGQGSGDLLAAFAEPLAKSTICDFLGIPAADRAQVDTWVEGWMVLWTPGVPIEHKLQAARAMPAYERYIAELAEARRHTPRDDALSDMVHTRIEGLEPLSMAEIIYMTRALRLAGHMTTRDWIAGALLMAMQRPELAAAMRADRSRILPFLDEVLRFDSPHKGFMRTASQDVVLAGVPIPRGARLHLLFASANRDSAVFDNPDAFLPGRADVRRHLGFSRGIHACMGGILATAETEAALHAALVRLPGLRLDGSRPLQYIPSHIFRALTALPAIWP